MLKRFGQTLLILIATMLVADPVMVCCFPSSLQPAGVAQASTPQSDIPSTGKASTDRPPCHGSKTTPASVTTETPDSDCPGCGDCSLMMSASQHVETLVLLETSSEYEPDAVHEASAKFATDQSSVAPDIPRRALPRIVTTPVTLKLKLHI